MSEPIIRVENLGKKYIIGHQQEGFHRYKSLRDIIADGAKSISSKLFKPVKRNLSSPTREEFWALKDVSFEIKQGDRVGIIGRNGAGKSTLLKILSRITEPTKGRIAIKGRVASLLEVGTGFHPELTGRENIFLNGAILGMSRTEIKRKFDEIVAFAEIEKFLDTPVKHYSSGMYVRLAFAVAAHLEPEILIVDEVLAVGDINFQKKCLGKMQDVSQGEGRTVLFVSHNMDAIQRLCSCCVMLEGGHLVSYGDTSSTVLRYFSSDSSQASPNKWIDVSKKIPRSGTGDARFLAVQYSSLNEECSFQPYTDGILELSLLIESHSCQSITSISLTISSQSGNKLIDVDTELTGQILSFKKGKNMAKIRIEKLYLNPGIYGVGLWLAKTGHEALDYIETAFQIEVINLRYNGFEIQAKTPVSCQFKLLEVGLT